MTMFEAKDFLIALNGDPLITGNFKMEHKKDYNLLRPFDLEAARRGEKICDLKQQNISKLLFSHKNGVVLEWEDGEVLTYGFQDSQTGTENLFMAPLCWIEGRPVYKGDVLCTKSGYVTGHRVDEMLGDQLWMRSDDYKENGFIIIKDATWTKPKQKREGWV